MSNFFGRRRNYRTYKTRRPRGWTKAKTVPNPNLCVYIIGFTARELASTVKIGVTGQSSDMGGLDGVGKRLKQLQTGNPWRLQVLKVIYRPDAYAFEDLLHQRFRKWRVRSDGEWFTFPEGVDPVAEITRVV